MAVKLQEVRAGHMEDHPSASTDEERKPINGTGDLESIEVTESNGTSNGSSNPKAATWTTNLPGFCKRKVPCWAVILLSGVLSGVLTVICILYIICALSGSQSPAKACPAKPCPTDWIQTNGRCYYLSEETKNWNDSNDFCKDHCADLLVMANRTKDNLKKLITKEDYWIGLKRDENTWKWVNGTDYNDELDYMNDKRLNCACLNGNIRALDCSTSRRFICSYKNIGVYTS